MSFLQKAKSALQSQQQALSRALNNAQQPGKQPCDSGSLKSSGEFHEEQLVTATQPSNDLPTQDKLTSLELQNEVDRLKKEVLIYKEFQRQNIQFKDQLEKVQVDKQSQQRLQREIDILKKENDLYQQKLQEIQQQQQQKSLLDVSVEELNQHGLQHEVDRLKAELSQLTQQLNDQQKQNAQNQEELKDQMGSLQFNYDILKKERDQLLLKQDELQLNPQPSPQIQADHQEAIEKLKIELSEAQIRFGAELTELAEKKQSELEQALIQKDLDCQSQLKDLKNQLVQLNQQQNKSLQDKYQLACEQVHEKDNLIMNLENQITEYKDKFKSQIDLNDTILLQKAQLDDEISRIKNVNDEKSRQFEGLQIQLNETTSQLVNLEQELNETKERLSNYQVQNDDKANQLKNLQFQFDEQSFQLAEVEKKYQESAKILEEKLLQLDALDAEKSRLLQEINELQQSNQNLKNQINLNQNEIEVAQQSMNELNEKIKQLNEEIEEVKLQYEQKIESLNQELKLALQSSSVKPQSFGLLSKQQSSNGVDIWTKKESEIKQLQDQVIRLKKDADIKDKMIIEYKMREDAKNLITGESIRRQASSASLQSKPKSQDVALQTEINQKLHQLLSDVTIKNFELEREINELKDLIRKSNETRNPKLKN